MKAAYFILIINIQVYSDPLVNADRDANQTFKVKILDVCENRGGQWVNGVIKFVSCFSFLATCDRYIDTSRLLQILMGSYLHAKYFWYRRYMDISFGPHRYSL
jgi:hypothetical protein